MDHRVAVHLKEPDVAGVVDDGVDGPEGAGADVGGDGAAPKDRTGRGELPRDFATGALRKDVGVTAATAQEIRAVTEVGDDALAGTRADQTAFPRTRT